MKTIKYLDLDIPLDDKKTWEYLSEAKNLKGLFQLETRSASMVLKRIKPANMSDLSICNALNRPGAASFTDDVSKVKNDGIPATYDHPDLEPILKETYGRLIYQESLMQCAQKLAGFSAIESNVLLKAMGKKDDKKMASLQDAFVNGMINKKYDKALAEKLFNDLKAFANYGFNKSHSVAYSTLGYITAYVKVHYPIEFFCSLLNFAQYEGNPLGEIFEMVGEMNDFALELKAPSIERLVDKFEIIDGKIHYPIGQVRSIGGEIFKKIQTLKTDIPLDALLESICNAKINKRPVEFMIIGGAFDKLGEREDILFYYWFLNELTDKVAEKFWNFKGGQPFSSDLIFQFLNFHQAAPVKSGKKQLTFEFDSNPPSKITKFKSHFHTEATRLKTLEIMQKKAEQVEFYKKNKYMARFFWEHFVLGYSYNTRFGPDLSTFADIEMADGSFRSCGFVEEVQSRTSKKGNPYGILTLKFDKLTSYFCFGETWEMAVDVIKEGDFIALSLLKDSKGIAIKEIENLTAEKRKYEFYNNVKTNDS